MFKKAIPFVMKVITPLHVGSGQDLGIVDLPIQRERHTCFPKIEASGLKGCIRDFFRKNNDTRDSVDIIFGPETSGDFAGALGFTDARILLFPVKSAKGVFAWITCPNVLSKLDKELDMLGSKTRFGIPQILENECMIAENSVLQINRDVVVLEEYCIKTSTARIAPELIEYLTHFTGLETLSQQLLIVSDDDFKDFVNLSTEVITRTKINPETGTVQTGALFTEEYLPAESVMYSLALASAIFTSDEKKKDFIQGSTNDQEAVLKYWKSNMPPYLQIGGNATIGKGLVEIVLPAEVRDESN